MFSGTVRATNFFIGHHRAPINQSMPFFVLHLLPRCCRADCHHPSPRLIALSYGSITRPIEKKGIKEVAAVSDILIDKLSSSLRKKKKILVQRQLNIKKQEKQQYEYKRPPPSSS